MQNSNGIYLIGNCFLCSLIIKMIYGGRMFVYKGHWMVKCKDGYIRHFERKIPLLPYPLKETVFIGQIITHRKNRKKK